MLGITTTNARVGGFRGLGKIAKLILAYFARVIAASGVTEGKVCLSNSLNSLDSKQLLDNASLVLIPSGYKESVLFSQVPTSGLGDLDVVRATTATRVNSAGLIELVPRNLLQYSNILTNAVWTKTNSTITSGQVSPTQPNNEGWLLNKTATGVDGIVYNAFNLNSLTTHSYSYYILKDNNETRFPEFFLRLNTGQVEQYVQVNTKTGAFSVRVASAGCTQSITSTADNLWWRLILTNPAPTAFTADNRHGVRPAAATVLGVYNINATGSVITYGAQVEEGSTASEYLPTVTRLNFPRLDYTNSSCPSLLVEPQRTNLATYSEDFSNVLWPKGSPYGTITVTANNTISPDGTQNADRIVFPAISAGQFSVVYFPFIPSAVNYTGSFYFKGLNGNETIWISYTKNGVNYSRTICNLTTSWQRFNLSALLTAGADNFQFGVDTRDGSQSPKGSQTIFAWGAQLEAGAYATSYIPTVAAAVTRNADNVSKTGISSLIGQTEGTILFDYVASFASADDLFAFGQNITNNVSIIQASNASIRCLIYYNSNLINIISSINAVANTRYKIAVRYKSGNSKIFINGVEVGSSSTSFAFTNSLNNLSISKVAYFSGANSNLINNVLLYSTGLTDAQCISLTTL
jgi:hypothetical protein